MPKTSWAAIGAAILFTAAPAFAAQDCAADLQTLAAKREAALKSINELVASAHGKKLDPDAFCARSRPPMGSRGSGRSPGLSMRRTAPRMSAARSALRSFKLRKNS